MRERLWARVNAKAKPLKGVKVKPGTQWLKTRPGRPRASPKRRAIAAPCDAQGIENLALRLRQPARRASASEQNQRSPYSGEMRVAA